MKTRTKVEKVIIEGTVTLPKSVLTNADIQKINHDLTYTGYDKIFYGYEEDTDNYYLPKFWYLDTFGKRFSHLVDNREPEGELKPKTFTGKLRTHQEHPTSGCTSTPELAALIKSCRGVFAEAPCGSGKTVSAVYAAAAVGGKTVVIVPTQAVFDQWVEAIQRFCPSMNIGYYGGGRNKLEGDIIICMLQTLYKHEGKKIDADLLIVDEAHMVAAEQFQKALYKVNFRYSLALTATGDRYDKLDPIFRRALSFTKVTLDTDQMPVTIHMYPFEHTPSFVSHYNKVSEFSKFMLDHKLQDDDERNAMLIYLICQMIEQKRRVLVLGKFKDHLKIIARTVAKITHKPYVLFMGAFTRSESAEAVVKMKDPDTVVFATLKKGGVGLDIQSLDTLINILPVSDPRQLIGRIQRALPGKKTPLVIDVVDNLEQMMHRAKARVFRGYLTIQTATVINRCPFLNLGKDTARLVTRTVDEDAEISP